MSKIGFLTDSCSDIPQAVSYTHLDVYKRQVQYLAMEHYEPARDADELNWQALWKRFFHALTIEERRNAKAQMNHAPKRFWGGMVEMREPCLLYTSRCV